MKQTNTIILQVYYKMSENQNEDREIDKDENLEQKSADYIKIPRNLMVQLLIKRLGQREYDRMLMEDESFEQDIQAIFQTIDEKLTDK
ncbi:hypothetical protein SS50377_27073 [Spironucleus salmonicida]|uniref:Uncharacterized protein n=2 Tax=Spironucleus salmonicida TaxID=348837 RepID=A0A9P8RVI1_9EUKA|nr:hypothetical protein SS50377_27073 [Spironucleus salmonicida]